MHARLLDMGEVGAVRSQSLCRGVAAALEPASDPVVVLVRPSASVVSLGASAPVRESVDLDFCRAERIPVVRVPRADGVWIHGPGHLLIQLAAPAERASGLGLGADAGRWPEPAGWPLVEVCAELGLDSRVGECGRVEVAGRSIARFEASQPPGFVAVWWDLFVVSGPRDLHAEAGALAGSEGLSAEQWAERITASRTAFGAELARPLGFATIAEALAGALETGFELELVPSMPTPAEMDSVYQWDERLLVSELLDEPRRGRAPYVM